MENSTGNPGVINLSKDPLLRSLTYLINSLSNNESQAQLMLSDMSYGRYLAALDKFIIAYNVLFEREDLDFASKNYQEGKLFLNKAFML
jgi:hypothetical protein